MDIYIYRVVAFAMKGFTGSMWSDTGNLKYHQDYVKFC